MNLQTRSGHIKAFFDVYHQGRGVIGIRLPTGWFGKPYDNYYRLISLILSPKLASSASI
jgi:hypothetical protein